MSAPTEPSPVDQCMHYSSPAAVTFDQAIPSAPIEPECWRQLISDNAGIFSAMPQPPTVGEAVLLLHGLTSPAGHERLVCITAANDSKGIQLRPIVVDITVSTLTASNAAIPMQVENHPDLPLRIHFGKVDEKDASRFSFSVDYEGSTQKIEGQLRDDDSVSLVPSFGYVDSGGIWQVEDVPIHQHVKEPIKVMQLGYPARIDGVGSFLSKNGKLLAIRSDNPQHHSQIDLWDVETEKKITSWDAGQGFAWPRFSDDGTSLTGLDNGQRLYLGFVIPTGRPLVHVDMSEIFTRPNSAHSFYMDGSRVAISSPDEGLVRFWDIPSGGTLLKRIHVPVEGQQNLTVSEDGKVMAFWQFQPGTKVLFFSVDTGRIISRQDVNPSLEEFGFTADDRDFIEITDDGLVFVDVASGKIHFRRGSGPTWRGAKISASRNVIVSSFDMGAFTLPAADQFCDFTFNGESISTNSLGVSGDGTRAVTLLQDGSWALWDLTAGK